MSVHSLPGFYVPWSAALAASTAEPVTIGAWVVRMYGVDVPVVQLVLAIAGVLMARPLARKKEAALPLTQFFLVTAIMLVIAVAWVLESPTGVLFTFVVAIGLGFSGYSLIETAGDQIAESIKRIITSATDALPSFKGKPK